MSEDEDFTKYTEEWTRIRALSDANDNDALFKIIMDRSETDRVRIMAVSSVGLHTPETSEAYQRIILDPTESIDMRSTALENLPAHKNVLAICRAMLAEPSPDLRFWAAFRLASRPPALKKALPLLDHLCATDHTLPEIWGWHVDREILRPLEMIHYFNLTLWPRRRSRHTQFYTWIVSPVAEYSSYLTRYRQTIDQWGNRPEQPLETDFRIHLDYLRSKLSERWPDIRFNARQPAPKAYVLDWLVKFEDERTLIGAVHRDGYALILTGLKDDVREFATWYRSVLPKVTTLYLYEWAGQAEEL